MKVAKKDSVVYIKLTHDEQADLRMCLLAASETPWSTKPAGVPQFAVALYALLAGQKPVKTIASKAELAAGGGFPCTLGCGRMLRTAARATSHAAGNAALKQGGHIAAK